MMRTSGLAWAIVVGGALAVGCGGSIKGGNATGGTGGGAGTGGSTGTGGSAGMGGTGGSAGMGGTGGGGTGGGGAGDGGGASDGSGAADGDPVPTPVPVTCESASPQCNDGLDNDSDGRFDMADGECVSPCDNDEQSFATGIPGDNMDACKQDCFFDGNSGQGDDGCNWDLRCDPASPGANAACPFEADRTCRSEQNDKCVRNCRKLTPNGCDCFGCCAVTYPGGSASVLLVSGCTADQFGNPTACPRCTQNTACVNTCEPCEVCIGKSAPDPGCGGTGGSDGGTGSGADGGTGNDAGPAPWCPTGVVSCGPTGQVPTDGCGQGFYCQTGCCAAYVID